MAILALPVKAPHNVKGEQSLFRSKLALWVVETSALFYHQVDEQDRAASVPVSIDLLREQVAKLDAFFPVTFEVRLSKDEGVTAVTFSELLGKNELQDAFLSSNLLTHGIDVARYSDLDFDESSQILSVTCKQDHTCLCKEHCSKFKSGHCRGRYWRNGQRSIELKHMILNQPVTLKLNKQCLVLPKWCDCHEGPVPSFDCSDLKCPTGQYTMALALCVIRDFDKDCLRNSVALANAYGMDHQVIEALVFASLLCKRLYQYTPKSEEITQLVVDEFRGKNGFTSMTVDPKSKTPLVLFEGKTKSSITKMLELANTYYDIKLQTLASDNNAAFAAVARDVFGDDFKWSLDPFHVLQRMTLTTFIPVIRGQLTRDRNTMKGQAKKEYQFLGIEPSLKTFADAHSDVDGDVTSKVSLYLRSSIMRDNPAQYIVDAPDIPSYTKDYIISHPLFRRLFEIVFLVRRALKASSIIDAEASLDAAAAISAEVGQHSKKYLSKLRSFATSLRRNKPAILNYVKTKLTSSIIEGYNSKIKLIKRSFRGYRNQVFFMLRCTFAFNSSL